MNKKLTSLALLSAAIISLAACSHKGQKSASSSDLKVAMITDQGGVDDKSFNQSAWEGLQAWGKSKDLKKGSDFNYFQSTNESEYVTNLDTAKSNGFNVIFGIGFNLTDSIKKASSDNADTKYAIVDDVIEGKDNVASITFADNEAAYLEGKSIAATQYASGADVIYQAAGGTGAGVFNEAKAINEKRAASDKVWVLGVDRDQKAEGEYTDKDGQKGNFVFASSIKEVGKTMQKVIGMTEKGDFPGGKVNTFGLKESGVNLTTKDLPEDVKKAVETARQDIISGKIKVPEK
ncbi:BMP family protein [Streptococcus uberis]|nr:BMP family protein [Streptococcus uberis]MCK1209855.1 BMP family protein [Streptococcus uberis]